MQVAVVIEDLVEALTTALPDAQVTYGKRGTVTLTKDQSVWIQDVTFVGTDVVMGDRVEELRYDIEVVYSATRRGPADQLLATQDVLGMFAAGVAAVRALVPPAGVLSIAPTAPRGRLVTVASKEARESAITAAVQVREDI